MTSRSVVTCTGRNVVKRPSASVMPFGTGKVSVWPFTRGRFNKFSMLSPLIVVRWTYENDAERLNTPLPIVSARSPKIGPATPAWRTSASTEGS